MGTAFIHFIGVNAYVFEADRLKVVMPNATKLGTSPQSDLVAHRPMLWKVDPVKGALFEPPRQFLWERLTFAFDPPANATSFAANLAPPTKVLGIPRNRWTNGGKDPDPLAVSGQVELAKGERMQSSIFYSAGCVFQEWEPAGTTTDLAAVRHEVMFRIQGVNWVKVQREGLVGQGSLRTWRFSAAKDDLHLVVGNVCACRLLGWQSNKRNQDGLPPGLGQAKEKGIPDHDFRWLSVLQAAKFDPGAPAPVMPASGCKYTANDPPKEIAAEELKGGGGGCGCECQGCVGEWV